MAKRFTDTDKWKKGLLRNLPAEYKLLWLYILDECDNAGIWETEFEVAELRLGIKLSKEKARGFFSEKVVELDNGTKWFVPDFIQFQYGELSEKNRAHVSVLQKIEKYQLKEILTNKPLTSPLQGAKEMVKEKEKDKDKEEEFGKSENLLQGSAIIPTICRNWYNKFPTYTKDQDQDFRAVRSIVDFMVRQHSLTDFTSPEAREMIEATMEAVAEQVAKESFWVNKSLKSIANNIQEFYNNIKNPQNGKKSAKSATPGSPEFREELKRKLEERFAGQGQ